MSTTPATTGLVDPTETTAVKAQAQPYVQDAATFWGSQAKQDTQDPAQAQAADFWQGQKQQKANQLQQSVSYGATQNPDEYAKNLRLAQQTGVSPEVAKDHQDILAPAAATSRMDYLNFTQAAPKTAEWATDPKNAAVAGVDELHRVGAIEQQSGFMSEAKSFLGATDYAIVNAIVPFVNALGVAAQATGETGKALLNKAAYGGQYDLGQNLKDIWGSERPWAVQKATQPILDYYASAIKQAPPQYIPDPSAPGKQIENPAYHWYQRPLINTLEQIPAQLMMFWLTGKLGGMAEEAAGAGGAGVEVGTVPGASLEAGAEGAATGASVESRLVERTGLEHRLVPALLGTQAAQNTYAEARAKGADQETAIASAMRSGLVNYFLMGAMPAGEPAETALGTLGQWAGRSAGLGTVMAVSDNAIARSYDPDRSLWEGIPQSIATMAAFEGVGALSNIVALAANSKLKARSPEAFQQAMEKIFEGQESLRIPVQQFETYFQSQNIEPAVMAEALGADNYAEAQTSGYVEVPTADFISKLDPKHQTALLPDIVDPRYGRTIRQHAEAQKELADFIASEGPAKLAAEAKAVDEETRSTPEYQKVKAELKKRFMEAGSTEAVAEANATLEANVHAYLARETGMQPTEVLALMNPRIRVGEAPGGGLEQSAFHGSPYRFDKFSLEHMGKGEGAQAYGHGLYFAGRRAIADWYRENLSANKPIPADVRLALQSLDHLGFDNAGQALSAIREEIKAGRDWRKTWDAERPEDKSAADVIDEYARRNRKGQLYEADIPDDEHMLHYDLPLSEQPAAVQEALKKVYPDANPESEDYDANETGASIYQRLAQTAGSPEAASKLLNEAGIQGIKYLDASSRARGEGSHNYVVFDDSAIKILKTFYQSAVGDEAARNRAEDRQWRNWEPETTSTGKIKGAPEWVTDRKGLVKMRGLLRKYVQEGLAGRFWYEDSAKAVMQIVGGDVQKAEKFIQLLAIYSPNSNVWVNTLQAVRAYTHWAAGRPEEEFKVGSGRADEKAKDVLYRDIAWEGRKTNSFYLKLMHWIVENHPNEVSKLNLDPSFITSLSKPATIDVWMGRAFDYNVAAFANDKGTGKYSFAENELRRMTAELNSKLEPGEERWTPHQVQAAIWTALKTRYEIDEVKAQTMTKSRREGLIYDELDEEGKKETIYGKTAAEKAQHLENWHHFAMQRTSDEVTKLAGEQARSFSEDLARMTNTVTWEAIPTTAIGHEINNASPEVKRLFTAESASLLVGENGEDLLAHQLGVPLSWAIQGAGAYGDAVSPNTLAHLLPARARGQEGFGTAEVRAYARAIQYIYKQDAVPFFRPENKPLTAASALKDQMFRVVKPDGGTAGTFDTQVEAENWIRARREGYTVQEKNGKYRVLDPSGKPHTKFFDTEAEADTVVRSKHEGYTVRGGDLARAMVLNFDKSLDDEALGNVLKSLQKYLGTDAGFTRTGDNEITVANFRDDTTKVPFARTDEDFLDAVEQFVRDNGKTHGIAERKKIWTEGEYGYVHDWGEDNKGDRILDTGGLGGRPDLQAWLRGRRDAYDQLLEKYSGESLAKLEAIAQALQAKPEEAESGAGAPGAEPGAGEPGARAPGESGTTLYQSGEQRPAQPRAWVTFHPDGTYEVGVSPSADPSSLPHEFAHVYMKMLSVLSKREGASDVIKGDYQKILDFLGAKDGEPLTTEQQEKFARARELYLREGKAPTKELRGVFHRFAVWLSSVYKKASDLGVELTPEMREVFARMHAGDAAVDKAEAESGPRLYNSPEEAGWTQEQFDKYAADHGLEADQARAEIMSQLNAAALRERTEAWQEEEDSVRAAKTDEIDARPEYRAIRALRKGELETTTEGEEPQKIALNKDELIKQFGEERVKALQALHRGLYRVEGGSDAQTAAEMLGYSSGEELMRALESAPRRQQAIERETRAYMTAKHGDIRYDGSLQDKARVALEGDQKASRLHQELQALQGKLDALKAKVAGARAAMRAIKIPPISAFREAAHAMIEAKAPVDLQPMRYLDASRKYSREAFEALRQGKTEEAAAAKHKELLNHFMYREAVKAKEYISDFEAYAKRAQGKQFQQTLGKAGGDYRMHFNGLLMRYGLMQGTPGPTGLEAFAQAQYDMGKEPAIDPRLMDESRVVNYQNATVSEVRLVNEALKNIRKLSNQELGMIVNGRRVEFANAVDAMAARARETNKVTPERVLQRNASKMEKVVNGVDWCDATILPAERLIDFLDGGKTGPWHDFLWNLAADSQGAEEAMNAEVTKLVTEAFEGMSKEQRHSMLDKFKVDGIPEEVTRHDLISMAFNMGNASNLERLGKTFEHHGWEGEVLDHLKNGLLSREDWEFIQRVWNVLGKVGEKSFAFEERMNGIPPVAIKPEPFTVRLPNGDEMHLEGGYYTVHYDPRFSHAGAVQEASSAQALMQPGYTRASTSKSHLKERSGYGGPLLFDFEQTLTQHLAKTIKDITHREFALAANKLLMHPTVRSALRETMGGKYEEQMLPWLKTIINDRNGSANQGLGIISSAVRTLRKNAILASLGFKLGTNILQVLHAPRMMLYTRPGAYLQALGDFLTNPRQFSENVRAMSPNEMASRGSHTDRDVREMMQEMTGQKGFRDRAVLAGMVTFKYIDQMMSFPLWMSVYRDTLGLREYEDLPESERKYQAMQAADRAVRLGLGAHSAKDLSPIMRNNDFTKLITVLYGFHSGVYGQLRAMGHELRYDGVKGIPKFTYGMLMAAIVPSILSQLVRGKGPDKKESVGGWAAKTALMYSLETIPLMRDIVSAMERHTDVKFSPLAAVIDKGVKVAEQATSGKKNQDYTALGLNALEVGGTLTGIPGTSQVIKPLRYYHNVQKGKIHHPNLYDAFIGSGSIAKH